MRISCNVSSYLPTLPPVIKGPLSKAAQLFQSQANLGNLSFASGLLVYCTTGNISPMLAGFGGFLGYHRAVGTEAAFMNWLLPAPKDAPSLSHPAQPRVRRNFPPRIPRHVVPAGAHAQAHRVPLPAQPRTLVAQPPATALAPIPVLVALPAPVAELPPQFPLPYEPLPCGISFDLIQDPNHLFTVEADEVIHYFNIYNLMIWAIKGRLTHPINPLNRRPLTEDEFSALLTFFGITKEAFQNLWTEAKTHGEKIYEKVYRKKPTSVQLRYMIDQYPEWYQKQLSDVRYRLFLERSPYRDALLQYAPSE